MLGSDNVHLLHQLHNIQLYLQYPVTEAPDQPKAAAYCKFPFTMMWPLTELIKINMRACFTDLITIQDVFLKNLHLLAGVTH